MNRTLLRTYAARMAAFTLPLLSLVALAGAPVSAQSTSIANDPKGSLAQLCTGAGKKFNCDDIQRQIPDDVVKNFMQSGNAGAPGAASGAPEASKEKIHKQIEEYVTKFNQGNGAPGIQPSTPAGSTPPDLQQLRDKAQKYLTTVGNQTPGGPSTTQPSAGGENQEPTKTTGNKPKDIAKTCEQLQESVDKRVAAINKRAQAQLANMTDIMNKLKDYQSKADPATLPAEAKTLMAQAEENHAKATQSVATLATLSVKLDCSQQNPAQGLSVIKTATEEARDDLKDLRASLSEMTGQYSAKAKPQQP